MSEPDNPHPEPVPGEWVIGHSEHLAWNAGFAAADSDRLRDERDAYVRQIERLDRMVREMGESRGVSELAEARRVAGALADALRETTAIAALHYPGSAIVKEARSALAAFDAVAGRDRSTPSGAGQPDARGDGTERHHDPAREGDTTGSNDG